MFSYSRIEYPRAKAYQFSMSLNLNIRPLRKAKNLTIAELAARVGISTPHMSEVERGVKNLNNHLLARISEALDVAPEELLSGDAPEDMTKVMSAMRMLSDKDQARVAAYAEALLAAQQDSGQKQ